MSPFSAGECDGCGATGVRLEDHLCTTCRVILDGQDVQASVAEHRCMTCAEDYATVTALLTHIEDEHMRE